MNRTLIFSLDTGRIYLLSAAFFFAQARSLYAGEPDSTTSAVELETITVQGQATRTLGPMQGLQLNKEQIPANVQSLSSKEIKESLSTSLGDLMNSKLQSVNVNDYAGNPFQMDISFRGFSASPQIGTPQGLSVFVDGVRVNEPFGDIVNWDLIPLNAIGSMDVFPGSNPLFGLNTLGGALSLRTKNGFDDPGVNVSFQGGSWDRKKGEISAGWNNGALGAFASFTGFDEEGWRRNSPSSVNQGFARFDWRGDDFSLRFSTLAVGNKLIGNGLIPMDLYQKDRTAVFTSPDQTENELKQYTLGGEFFFNDEWSLTGQIYRRDSSRDATTGDIYEDFTDMVAGGPSGNVYGPSDGITTGAGVPVCRYADANRDKIPDYYFPVDYDRNGDGTVDDSDNYNPDGSYFIRPESINAPVTEANFPNAALMPALNGGGTPSNFNCAPLHYPNPGAKPGQFDFEKYPVRPRNGRTRNGSGIIDPNSPAALQTAKGWVDGTPIGIISKTQLEQQTDGANLQLNYNSVEHKFMLGGSIDAATTDFDTRQRLGLIDANRRVYLAPNEIAPIFKAAREDVINNSFKGKSTTVSGYFSETYSPSDNLHLSLSGRFNHTRVKNNMRARARAGDESLHNILDVHNALPDIILCEGSDLSTCGNKANYFIERWDEDSLKAQLPIYGFGKYKERPSSEIFDYTSFNPSVGISYLPFKETEKFYKDLNLFFNWSRGTRAPSSVELGCGYDGTPVFDPANPLAEPKPKSLATIGGACTLPTSLSGDPYLPQIKADSYEFGLRGKLFEGSVTSLFHDINWNASIYRTDLRNDIYLVGITPDRSFFDTIGETRRQGIEFGFSGTAGIVDFSVNYGFTDATFQSDLIMLSPHNSSAENRVSIENEFTNTGRRRFDANGRPVRPFIDMMQINKGDRMPGIPLHNINATLNFHLTPKWEFGVTMIAHSDSFARGNENNDHVRGIFDQIELPDPNNFDPTGQPVQKLTNINRQFKDAGSIPGYVVFNLKTRYEIFEGFSVFGMINNLFDRQYATAGRLGFNPFSPSQRGAIGPSGWNYNSDEWQGRTFVGPGAPRAIWVGVDYKF